MRNESSISQIAHFLQISGQSRRRTSRSSTNSNRFRRSPTTDTGRISHNGKIGDLNGCQYGYKYSPAEAGTHGGVVSSNSFGSDSGSSNMLSASLGAEQREEMLSQSLGPLHNSEQPSTPKTTLLPCESAKNKTSKFWKIPEKFLGNKTNKQICWSSQILGLSQKLCKMRCRHYWASLFSCWWALFRIPFPLNLVRYQKKQSEERKNEKVEVNCVLETNPMHPPRHHSKNIILKLLQYWKRLHCFKSHCDELKMFIALCCTKSCLCMLILPSAAGIAFSSELVIFFFSLQ